MPRRTRSTAPTCDTSQVHVVRNVRIPMSDGLSLAADLHFPTAAVADGTRGRFPAIIEYTPYHKRNNRAYGPRATRYPYFAANGYVFVNVDIRGCGDSEGWSESPSSPEEIHVNVEVVRWCARQPWCDGQVGMIGISYTAGVCFDAARQAPDELKAVIICQMCSDWYQGMACPGGTPRLFGFENYAPLMAAYNFAPPDAELLGERWLEVWRQRLDHSRPWSLAYAENLLDGPFWESRLLRGHEDRVKAAVFLIGGWSDWYPDDMLRVYSRLRSPKRIVIGPWTHNYPENAWPLPRINDRYECLRWFDRHLKGIDTDPNHPVDAEPPVTLFVREYAPPAPLRRTDPGSFRDVPTWPPPDVSPEPLFLSADGRMLRRQAAEGACPLVYQPDVGHAAGRYVIGHMLPGWGMPDDQRLDEPFSLVFTAAGLPGGNQGVLLGAPEARLFLSSTAEVAFVSAKLCDVAPDGTSAMITKGLLNLTHRDGDIVPKPLVPGQIYDVRLALLAHAYRLLPGHRLRLMLAAADFQNAWPTPVPHVLTLHCGPEHPSQLILPLARNRAPSRGKPRYLPSEFPPDPPEDLNLPEYTVERDLIGGLTTVRCKTRSGVGMNESSYTISHQRPAVAVVESSYDYRLEFPDKQVLVMAKCAFQSDETMFHHQVEIQILVDDLEFWTKTWQTSVARQGW